MTHPVPTLACLVLFLLSACSSPWGPGRTDGGESAAHDSADAGPEAGTADGEVAGDQQSEGDSQDSQDIDEAVSNPEFLVGDIRLSEISERYGLGCRMEARFWPSPVSEFGDEVVEAEGECRLLGHRVPELHVSAGVLSFSGLQADVLLEPFCNQDSCAYVRVGDLPEDGDLFADDAVIGVHAVGDQLEAFDLEIGGLDHSLTLQDLEILTTSDGNRVISWTPGNTGEDVGVEYQLMLYCHLGCEWESILCRSADDGEIVIPASMIGSIWGYYREGGWRITRYREVHHLSDQGVVRLRVGTGEQVVMIFP